MKNVTLSGRMSKRNVVGRFVEMNRGKIVELISALFILLFLYTALSKSVNIVSTKNALEKTPLASAYPLEIAWTIVIIEYIVAILLFIPQTKKIGLYASLFLMVGFSAYIIYMKLFISDLPCSCGGVISKMTWGQHLLFNLLFALLAFWGILLMRKEVKNGI